MADYIPSNDAAFDQWFKFMNQYVNQKCTGSTPEWTHIPQAAREEMAGAYAAWYTAWSNFQGPHTKVDTEAKDDAKKAGKKKARAFVNQYLRFPPVTNEDRTAMAIPNHDTHPAPVPHPGDIPEVEAQTPKPRVLRFRFRRYGMKRWGMPKSLWLLGLEFAQCANSTP
jgi:hypothetical protein